MGSPPKHVAIVMDGNRRWAKSRFLPAIEGHRQGVKAVRRVVEASLELAIPTLTLYTFSAENWNRTASEVASLMSLLSYHLRNEVAELDRSGVRVRGLGRIGELPQEMQLLVQEMEETTKTNTRLNLNIALNYGGRQEIVDAVRAIALEAIAGKIHPTDITEEIIADHLTTVGQPDPDLLIRTSGEQRISNFLLWQLAYTEMIFLPILWPEFDKSHLEAAVLEYSRRERRFGATN